MVNKQTVTKIPQNLISGCVGLGKIELGLLPIFVIESKHTTNPSSFPVIDISEVVGELCQK